jgi:hypothetical protein
LIAASLALGWPLAAAAQSKLASFGAHALLTAQ